MVHRRLAKSFQVVVRTVFGSVCGVFVWMGAVLCRGERVHPMCEEPSKLADECCSEVYDGTLLQQSPSSSRFLESGVYFPGYSSRYRNYARHHL
jgi:hypothetical protein